MKIAIIGSGLSGLACANQLVAAGHQVSLFDKARGPGGRMSTRRIETTAGDISFDHGAQYFTARDPDFQMIVDKWGDKGVASRWPAAGTEAWVGVPSMNAPVKALATGHDVTWATRIEKLLKRENSWQLQGSTAAIDALFDAVVFAIPAEQAADLLKPWQPTFAATAAATVSEPCWTLMLAFEKSLGLEKPIFRDDPVIGWAARNSDKPGRKGPESWVIQASPTWSTDHLEDNQDQVVTNLSDRFAEISGTRLPEPLIASAHRWRYARSGRTQYSALYDDDLKIGVCGDWMLGPRVECAWLSGTALAKMILD
ncbi:NAD(P)/FAD-dependent oxidoreductase [Parasphingorhabdus cellanae]|uniref:NAD(P)-binding protein n=1 Tax=Parasphingorhabdus cellanae TaxID=2806553 RepID=A0ABX7T7D8_9SPHN|nr:NAD(P)-binding protein [Parasphingorhabdus cellanae]QTD57516.1 NAD(P)-binding protein [Parasphingorhabdus cellanae]